MRLGTILKLAAVGVLFLVVALVQVVKSIDVNAYRGLLAQAAKAATGRQATINGKLSLRVSLSPALVANDVVLANAAGGSRAEMVRIDHLEAEIGLLPLLAREVRVSRLTITGLDILLERDGAGRANWDFPAVADAFPPAREGVLAYTSVKISEVSVKGGEVHYRDEAAGRRETVRINQLAVDSDGWTSPLAVTLDGSWGGRHLDVSGMFGSPGDLTTPGKPTALKLRAVLAGLVVSVSGNLVLDRQRHPQFTAKLQAEASDLAESAKMAGISLPPMGAARVSLTAAGTVDAFSLSEIDLILGRRDAIAFTLKGSVKNALLAKGLDMAAVIDSDNLAAVNRMFTLSLPAVGPIRISGHVSDDDRGGWRLTDLKGVLGHGDISGEASLRRDAERLRIDSRLTSASFDLGEWFAARDEPARARPADGRLFPDDPLPFALLTAADGQLSWQIDHLLAEGLVADQVGIAVSLKEGRLAVTPEVKSLAGGHLSLALVVDANARPPAVSLTLAGERLGLGQALQAANLSQAAKGMPSDIKLSLKGGGGSIRALLARLNGDIVVTMGAGTLLLEQGDSAAVDLLSQLANWSKSGATEMLCMVSRFTVAEGLARSEALLLDTSLMTVGGRGSVNLANETLDLTLAPKPKDAALLSAALPLDIGGTLAHPVVAVDQGAIVRGVVTAVGAQGLGAAAPGNTDANSCIAALTATKKNGKKPGKAGD
ncbi:MAG TPA: AsmA family protein [Rhodospirillaceae bacterium]|nr:AsmA family protein [Rhodospirillaceae bacterium]